MGSAYITGLGVFLPNNPVDNENIENVLGMINGKPSRTKSRILRNNGIKTRHYAIDPNTGKQTHTNAQLTAEAVRSLCPSNENFDGRLIHSMLISVLKILEIFESWKPSKFLNLKNRLFPKLKICSSQFYLWGC
uniref:hypothetical protein n=1 Tax=Hassallia byssoidea TaxID=482630 RepID=UPI001F1AADAC|nr:hypothetical protein [Hassalia byssoidea]